MATGKFTVGGANSGTVIVNESARLCIAFLEGAAGTVKLQQYFPELEDIDGIDTWRDVPDAIWTENTVDVICAAQTATAYRLVATGVTGTSIYWVLG